MIPVPKFLCRILYKLHIYYKDLDTSLGVTKKVKVVDEASSFFVEHILSLALILSCNNHIPWSMFKTQLVYPCGFYVRLHFYSEFLFLC